MTTIRTQFVFIVNLLNPCSLGWAAFKLTGPTLAAGP
jgi:hypothetical protein